MAADDGVCGGPNMTLLLQRNRIPPDTIWMPSSAATAHDDLGMNCMVTFENVAGADSMDAAFSIPIVEEEHGNEDSDICFPPPVKKRRLTIKQVQFLERSFEAENKLEPDRKMQLAKELGLQPRQVAIWFQNRRARFRNKQLEKDYMSLRASFDQLKSDCDNLVKENENLRTEVLSLKEKSPSREKGIEKQEPVDDDDDDDAGNSSIAELQTPAANPAEMVSNVLPVVAIKQEDASSAKSDVFDPDRSPSLLEPTDSSHVLEPDQSDFSQDEEDNSLSRNLLPQPYFLNFYQDPTASSCNFEFPVEDQYFWSWNY